MKLYALRALAVLLIIVTTVFLGMRTAAAYTYEQEVVAGEYSEPVAAESSSRFVMLAENRLASEVRGLGESDASCCSPAETS